MPFEVPNCQAISTISPFYSIHGPQPGFGAYDGMFGIVTTILERAPPQFRRQVESGAKTMEAICGSHLQTRVEQFESHVHKVRGLANLGRRIART